MKKVYANLMVFFFALLTFTASAQVVISEIHYHPVEEPAFNADGTPFLYLTNDVHEFVELQNTGTTTVDLSGWTIAGGIGFTFPASSSIAAGEFRVIAKTPARLATVYLLVASNIFGPYSGYLGNGSDTVRVRDASGNTIDAVTYGSTFPWAGAADALGAADRFTGLSSTNYQYKGRSLQRVSVTWPSGDPANWLASPLTGPTPGAAQSVTRTIPKPVVIAKSAVQASDGATIIRSNQPVIVNCTYSATNNLNNVALEYFLDNINSTSETHVSLSMTNLGNGKYTSAIPGQTNRTFVRYRFSANRGDGLEVVSPRSDDPQIAPIGTSGAREAWWGYFVTPLRTTTNAAIYDVLIGTNGLTNMGINISQSPNRVTVASAAGLPRDVPYVAATAAQWDGTVAGVFAADGQLYDIQIRYHGSKYHRATSNLSYKVHFPNHQPLNGRSSWFETLHGTEFIEGQKLNRLIGLPASKMRQVDWYLNANADLVHSEQGEYDGDMLDDYHDLQQELNPGTVKEEAGELYKDVGNRDASQNNLEGPYTRGDGAPMLTNANWTQLQRYDWTYTLQNNDWKGSKPVRDLIEGMWTARGDTPATHNFSSNATTLTSARAWFTTNWDMPTTITSIALLQWMSIWDDAAQNHFYWRRVSGLWSRLGWDYDGVLSTNGGGGSLGGTTNQTIYGGEFGATNVFDGVNWWMDTFLKCYRTEFNQKLWELNNSFCDPTNLAALGFNKAAAFANNRRSYINNQLSSLGTYYKPARPTNNWPTNGATILSATNFLTSAYAHPQSTPQLSTKWEIRSASGDYEEPVVSITSTNSKTNYAIPFDQLTYGKTYYWRATYMDTNGHPSIVSAETSFTWGTTSATAGSLVLNEILAENRSTVQNGGKYPDYIELKNNTASDISLTGYALSDDPLKPTKFTFTSTNTVPAGGYLLIWCDSDTNSPGLHTGFGIDSAGETVLLLNSGSIVDSVTFGPQAPDVSIGRIVDGTGGWQANTPTPLTSNSAKTLGSVTNLRVNEWMADPAYGDDWYELYNTDSNVVALAGLYMSDTPGTPMITQIPALSFIEGHGFTEFFADGSTAGGNHSNFKLAKGGESLVLTAANGATTIDTITFSSQTTDVSQGRLPDGGATIVSFTNKTASPGNPNWATTNVVINEIVANSTSPLEDAIELYNTGSSTVNIGGWWLSDDLINRQKFQIPSGATITAGGYKTFYAADFAGGAVPFSFGASGDEVILSAVDSGGNLNGYGSLVRFGASAENTSFGRVAATGLNAGSGNAEFWPQTAHTFGQDSPASVAVFRTGTGAVNSTPKIGSVTINEIMYHPPDGVGSVDDTRDEFIELYNITPNTVNIGGWRLRGDTEYIFPGGTTMAAGSYLLLVSFDPTNTTLLTGFRTNYTLGTNTVIYGPYSQVLANSTFDIELAYPAVISGYTNYVNVDKVEYRDTSPWATTADGGGKSLQRSSSSVIGNTAANWTGNTPTPGAVNLGVVTVLTITTTTPLTGGVVGVNYTNALSASGGSLPYSWAITAGSVNGLILSTNGVLSGTPATAGTNSLTIQVTDSLGAIASGTFTLVIASTAPFITTTALNDGAIGTAYSQILNATGGTTPYVWSVASGTLPGGLRLNGAGAISGTPTNYGVFNFSASLTDNNGLTATKTLSINVPVSTLVLTSVSPMVNAQLGTAYSQALTASGGVTPYAWSIASGLLPPGLSLDTLGDVTGTPTNVGTYSFTARVTDNLNTSVTKSFGLTVISPTLVILTGEIPDSLVGAAYTTTLSASGGTTPYFWSVIGGALPAGLVLSTNGAITGTPTNSGTYSFTVLVTDAASTTAQELFTVDIDNNEPVITLLGYNNRMFSWSISGDSGPDYAIEASTNCVDWTEIFFTNTPTIPFQWSATNDGTLPTRIFRVRLDQ